ncbi:ribosome recycling factor [Buchnera aphidicola]|uniref:ribosome recycling factor n=1 Tax=Buchnera aphidicola TaxID=9 RepID=UPI003463E13D
MVENIQKYVNKKMEECIVKFKKKINTIRTGRVSTDILNGIFIEYYGKKIELKKIANITIENSQTLKVTPFENSIQKLIEKKIISSNLGLNPISKGNTILIKIPFLTEERRKELVKIVKNDTEKVRINIRNIRRDAKEKIKKLLIDKVITKDKDYTFQSNLQIKTNFFIKKIDNILKKKELELMNF